MNFQIFRNFSEGKVGQLGVSLYIPISMGKKRGIFSGDILKEFQPGIMLLCIARRLDVH